MDRLLFGDNQFFGINHMSEEKARAQQMRFQRLDAVMEVLDAAYDEGVRTFMCTTHDRIAEICDIVRATPDAYPDMMFFPCMPYAHKYANAITEDGFLGAMRQVPPRGRPRWRAALKGTSSLARKDIEGIATLLIDAELKMFAGPAHARDLDAERRRRPAARSGLHSTPSGSSPTTCGPGTARSRGSSR